MITPEQRELRKRYIGSSDSPAILGVDPFRSASAVYLEKTGQLEEFEGNEHTERGNLLEPVLLGWAGGQLKTTLERDKFYESGVFCANLDGCGPDFIVEAKTSSNPDEWGTPGTDEVPDRVIVQTHHAMLVSGFRLAYVPVLLPGFRSFDFRMYRVEFDPDVGRVVAETGEAFWRDHVQARVEPPDFCPSLEVLKRIRRVPNKIVAVPAEIVVRVVAARAEARAAEKYKEAAERDLLAALGDAEGGTWDGGELTYMETKRRGYTVAETTYRQLRLNAAKEK